MTGTTEEALRRALAELGGCALALLAAEHGTNVLSPMLAREFQKAEAGARAALALPVTPSRVEWGVKNANRFVVQFQGQKQEAENCAAKPGNGVLVSRISAGPWLPYQGDEKV